MANTIRLQVDILEKQLDELEELQKLGGLRSKRELWDTAFTLLKWATRKRSQGFSVGSMTQEGVYTELEMPFLEHHTQSVHSEQVSKSNNAKSVLSGKLVTASGSTKRRTTGSGTLSLANKRQTA